MRQFNGNPTAPPMWTWVFKNVGGKGKLMLDPQYIRDNLDAVKTNCKNRNVSADVDRVVTLDDERKRLISAMQAKQQEGNATSAQIPLVRDPKERQELIKRGRAL